MFQGVERGGPGGGALGDVFDDGKERIGGGREVEFLGGLEGGGLELLGRVHGEQSREHGREGGRGDLRVAGFLGERPVVADDAVALGRGGPERKVGDGLGAEQRGRIGAGSVGGERGSVGGCAESEGGVEGAEHHGFVGDGFRDEGGEGGSRGVDGGVVDGEGGFADEVGIGVGQELGDFGGAKAAQGEKDAETGGGRRVADRGGKSGQIVAADKTHHEGVAQVGIGVGVGAQGGEEGGDGVGAAEFTERLGGEEFYARGSVGERIDEERESGCDAAVAEEFYGLSADFRVGRVGGEGGERGEGGGILRGELAEAPDGVEAGVRRVVGIGGDLGQRGETGGAAGGEFELRGAADAGIGVAEQRGELGGGDFGVVGGDEFFGLGDDRVVGTGGIGHGVDAAALGLGPAVGPVGPIEAAVGAEFHVGRERAAEEALGGVHGVGGAVGFQFIGEDAGAGDVADEGGDEKSAAERLVEAGAGVVSDAGGAVLEVGEGREVVGRLAGKTREPDALAVPRAGVAHRGVLVADAPAGVAALDDVDKAFHVAVVAVVVAGEKIADFVEKQVLGVAQAGGEEFDVGAVEVAAENGAVVRGGEGAGGRGDVGAAVANAVVELAVGADDEAVHIVAGEVEADAVAGAEVFAGLGFVGAGEGGEAGDVGEIDGALVREDAGGDAVDGGVEALGVERGGVGGAGAGAIFDEAHALGLLAQFGHALGAKPAGDHRAKIVLRAVGELVFEDPHVVADIEDAGAVAVGLGDEGAALFVEVKSHGVGEHGLGGPEGNGEAGREFEALKGEQALVGGGVDLGLGLALHRLQFADDGFALDGELGGAGGRGGEQSEGESGAKGRGKGRGVGVGEAEHGRECGP